ncbi:MAG: hypothetical protein J5646_05770 [Bacteroidales bacterium]|nr:hypothetical protein [Bacteroidales bacterium]
MKRIILLGALALAALVSCNKGDNDPRLVIITYDGLRWQEVYGGADKAVLDENRFVKDMDAFKAKYWRDTPEERRATLLPFLWSYVPEHGYMLGNRNKNSKMEVANRMWYSYPGYSEMFCGWADDERVHSNDPVPNPNVSVLEVVNQDPRYKGKVMMYASWESIRFAVNNDRGGFPGSAGHEPSYTDSDVARMIQDMDAGLEANGFGQSERMDCITYAMAMETLKKDHPKVFYVGFGDTDEYGHEGDYTKYLDSAHWTDLYIRRIVEYCESDPFYKGKTTYMLLNDHGRGLKAAYRSHGSSVKASNQTWFMTFGKGVPVLGETENNGIFNNRQLAATIADVLGVDFTPSNGIKYEPFDPAYAKEADPPVAQATLEAVKVTPKGKGIRYAYNEGDFKNCQDVVAAPVKKSGIVSELGTKAIKQTEDHFGIVFKGLVKIEKDGLYMVSLCSDDGSKLWLDGQQFIDIDQNGGGYREVWLQLAAGYHRMEVQFWENYGGDDVMVGLVGPGIEVENLPADMLFYE